MLQRRSEQAMAASPSPTPSSTPKRKRERLSTDDLASLSTSGTEASIRSSPQREDGSNSPRTRVAQRFRDLAIGGGGGAMATGDGRGDSGYGTDKRTQQEWADTGARTRKRIKTPRAKSDDGSPSPSKSKSHSGGAFPNRSTHHSKSAPTSTTGRDANLPAGASLSSSGTVTPVVADPTSITVSTAKSAPAGNGNHGRKHRKSPPRSTPRPDGKPRSRKRAGTPPLKPKTSANNDEAAEEDDGEERTIVDPVRAALTWHEDEITVYDPDDSDDDGTGVNGIGFKPTAAIAHSRTVKRRQQLVEYRKREEREARAQRSRRRRGSPSPSGLLEMRERANERRRVRFMEGRAGAAVRAS